jgi:hypothetical protein
MSDASMTLSDGVDAAVPGNSRGPVAGLWRRRGSRLSAIGLTGVLAAGALAGCGISEQGIGTLALDPGRYALYHCNDLVERLKGLMNREKELRNLMDKASESTGGALIGALSYRTDYETTLSDEKLVRRVAAEKNCALGPPTYQSDQTIR